MSLAVATVSKSSSVVPYFALHDWAYCFARWLAVLKPVVVRTSGWAALRASFCLSVAQRTGADDPTPRGSNPTRSYIAVTAFGNAAANWTANWRPDPPGPPGLTSSEALGEASDRCRRTSATVICLPVGSAWSSGTDTVAHSVSNAEGGWELPRSTPEQLPNFPSGAADPDEAPGALLGAFEEAAPVVPRPLISEPVQAASPTVRPVATSRRRSRRRRGTGTKSRYPAQICVGWDTGAVTRRRPSVTRVQRTSLDPETGNDIVQRVGQRLLELLIRARLGGAVVAPSHEVGQVPEAGALHVLVLDLEHPLGTQRHEREVLRCVPPADVSGQPLALVRLGVGPLLPRVVVAVAQQQRLELVDQFGPALRREGPHDTDML